MPSSEPEPVYWDSDVLLAYVNGEDGRVENIRALLNDADRGLVQILTSTLSVTEVAFAAHEKAGGALDAEADENIRQLWLPPSPINLVEFHFRLAERSRDMIRIAVTNGWRLKPPDAIHLATAESVGAVKLHTYNLRDFERWGGVLGMSVEEPISAKPQML
jgi:predicted nucleic acid-binding protein